MKLAWGVYWVKHCFGQFQLDVIGQVQLDDIGQFQLNGIGQVQLEVIGQVQLNGAGRGLVLGVTPLPTIDTNLRKGFAQLRKIGVGV